MRIGSDGERTALLKACLAQAVASHEWFDSRILPLSADQLRWKPRPGRWSLAECLDHLNRTFGHYLSKIEQARDGGFSDAAEPMDRPVFDEAEAIFLQQVEPPVLIKMSAPAALMPNPAVDPDQIIDQFPELRGRFERAVQWSARLDLLNIVISDSLHLPIQSLGGVIAMLAAHERRHIWQAQQILRELRFAAPLDEDDRWGIEKGAL